MNGSPTHPAKEKEATAAAICVFRNDEDIGILARAIANRPPNEDRLRGVA